GPGQRLVPGGPAPREPGRDRCDSCGCGGQRAWTSGLKRVCGGCTNIAAEQSGFVAGVVTTGNLAAVASMVNTKSLREHEQSQGTCTSSSEPGRNLSEHEALSVNRSGRQRPRAVSVNRSCLE